MPALPSPSWTPTWQSAHTQPRCPQTSICSPISQTPSEIPPAQHIARRGCFARAPFFPRGWPSCLLPPPLLELSCVTVLLFLIGVFPECSRNTTGLVSITAQTPFDKQKAEVKGPSGVVQDRSCPPGSPAPCVPNSLHKPGSRWPMVKLAPPP